MRYTPEERRIKLNELISGDPDASAFYLEYLERKELCERFADKLPRFIRDKIYGYPAMCHIYHQQILSLVCERMMFPDDEDQSA